MGRVGGGGAEVEEELQLNRGFRFVQWTIILLGLLIFVDKTKYLVIVSRK